MDEIIHTTIDAGSCVAIESCIEEVHFDLLLTHFVPTHGWNVLTVEHVQGQIVF